MTSGLVNAGFSLPEWQAVKMIFFAPGCCHLQDQSAKKVSFTACDLSKHALALTEKMHSALEEKKNESELS